MIWTCCSGAGGVVGQQRDAGGVAFGLDHGESVFRFDVLEEGFAFAEYDGVDGEAVFVDQVEVGSKRSSEKSMDSKA